MTVHGIHYEGKASGHLVTMRQGESAFFRGVESYKDAQTLRDHRVLQDKAGSTERLWDHMGSQVLTSVTHEGCTRPFKMHDYLYVYKHGTCFTCAATWGMGCSGITRICVADVLDATP